MKPAALFPPASYSLKDWMNVALATATAWCRRLESELSKSPAGPQAIPVGYAAKPPPPFPAFRACGNSGSACPFVAGIEPICISQYRFRKFFAVSNETLCSLTALINELSNHFLSLFWRRGKTLIKEISTY
jgi:hypothetical protein